MTQIAFIGLGNMGAPMAANLLKAGHQLAVFDLAPAAVAKLEAAGARVLGVLAVVDRQQGGRERIAQDGHQVVSLTTTSELGLVPT